MSDFPASVLPHTLGGDNSPRQKITHTMESHEMVLDMAVHGLAGTGKSKYMARLVKSYIEAGALRPGEILFLSFDRLTRKRTIRRSAFLDELNTLTVHSFCHRVLKRCGRLPDRFTRARMDPDAAEDFDEEDYDSLVGGFLRLNTDALPGCEVAPEVPLSAIRLVLCDEVQDFRRDYIEVVKKIMLCEVPDEPVWHVRPLAFQDSLLVLTGGAVGTGGGEK